MTDFRIGDVVVWTDKLNNIVDDWDSVCKFDWFWVGVVYDLSNYLCILKVFTEGGSSRKIHTWKRCESMLWSEFKVKYEKEIQNW